MKKMVLASNNLHKIEEIREKLKDSSLEIISLNEAGIFDELPETTGTIEGNAQQKAEYIFKKYGMDCIADDSGLEIEALDSKPGVDSAHYSGSRDADANMNKVLAELNGNSNRKAQFVTVISFCASGNCHLFKGIVEGKITNEKQGDSGFGYDPIFIPDGYSKTFAEMSSEEKNKISHRGRAIEKWMEFLRR